MSRPRSRPEAARLLDYSHVWRSLDPAERENRITTALERIAEGETLQQVAQTWQTTAATLCRALLAYAPTEWRRALATRAIVQWQHAQTAYTEDARNPAARAREYSVRWQLDYALRELAAITWLTPVGRELRGPCVECGEMSVYLSPRRAQPARCVSCGWEDSQAVYLARVTQQTTIDGMRCGKNPG